MIRLSSKKGRKYKSKPVGTTLPLKVLIDKTRSKVLFAEGNGDFADVLISFLTLPLGKMVKILSTKNFIWSISSLSTAISNLDRSHFCAAGVKQMLLDPASSFQQEYSKLKLDITDSQPLEFFICEDIRCKSSIAKNISMYCDIASCASGKPLNRRASCTPEKCGAFTPQSSTFIVSDDLHVAPIAGGILKALNKLGITDTKGAHLIHLDFNLNDIMKLLEFSLFSATPMTDFILEKSFYTTPNTEPGVFLHHGIGKGVSSSKKMVLRVMMQKSTNKLLFAEATHEFVEFLFSFLIIPLGGVASLLGGNTLFRSIDNLQRSVTDLIDDKYFVRPDIKTRLMKHAVAHGYISKNPFLPLTEGDRPKIFYTTDDNLVFSVPFFDKKTAGTIVSSFKRVEKFVNESSIFFVDDNLNVTPSLAANILVLNGQGIPLSDLKEMEFDIGQEEALRILRVALTSKTVLTDALIKPMLNKLTNVKQEP